MNSYLYVAFEINPLEKRICFHRNKQFFQIYFFLQQGTIKIQNISARIESRYLVNA
jgi:hypothetical protein